MISLRNTVTSLFLLALSVPALAGDILFVSDSTTDSQNIPAVLSGGAGETAHPDATIAAAGGTYRPAATADDHDVTIFRFDYVKTGGGPFPMPAQGTNPTLAGLTTGVTLSDYCAIYWSAAGPHEPDLFGGGLGTDGGLHTDAAVFTSLLNYVAAGGYVFVTGHDAHTDPTDQLLIDFLTGTVSTATSAEFEPAAPMAVSLLPTVLSTGVTDITDAVPGATVAAGVAGVGTNPDQDALSGLAGDPLGVVAQTGSPGSFLWTVRTPLGLPSPIDYSLGHIAYVAAGIPFIEDLPFNNPPTPPFVLDGEDSAWLSDPVYTAALQNFALSACAPPCLIVPVINLNGAASVTLECGVDTYTEQGASVVADCDATLTTADVSGDVVDSTTLGSYQVMYNATDVHGNAAVEVTRAVTVVDTTAPTLTLNGAASVTLALGDSYTESGATASDACDAAVAVGVGGDVVDTNTVGTYIVEYDAMDSSGNTAAQLTRTVEVTGTVGSTFGPLVPVSDVSVTWSRMRYNRRTGQISVTATVQNDGASSIVGELYLGITEIVPAVATVDNATGSTTSGTPLLTVGVTNLPPGGTTSVVVQFQASSRARFTLETQFYGPQ